MKKIVTPLILGVLLLAATEISGQESTWRSPAIPLKQSTGLLYGTDVILNNSPDQDQRHACLAAAFNGWLYAGFLGTSYGDMNILLYKSTDNGENWELFSTITLMPGNYFRSLEILACGNTEPELEVFVGFLLCDPISTNSYLTVNRYNGVNASLDGTVFSYTTSYCLTDFDFASDYNYPSEGSSPYSVGIAVIETQPVIDQVRFWTSSDGGLTFGNEKVVHTTLGFTHKVSVAFGRSASLPSGRYFVAWDEMANAEDVTGKIFSAYTQNGFNDKFTTPYRLDEIDGSVSGFCRNPVIACQFGPFDNDMENLTALVLAERASLGSTGNFDIVGFYNKEAVNSDNWSLLTLAGTSDQELQPDACFDPVNNNFLVTMCDSSAQKLPCYIKTMSIPDADNWKVVTAGYNDGQGLVAPWPRIAINPEESRSANIWQSDNSSGHGVVTFDAEYSMVGTYNPGFASPFTILAFPNPFTNSVHFKATLPEPGRVEIILYNSVGQVVSAFADMWLPAGSSVSSYDLQSLPQGVYFYTVRFAGTVMAGQLVKVW